MKEITKTRNHFKKLQELLQTQGLTKALKEDLRTTQSDLKLIGKLLTHPYDRYAHAQTEALTAMNHKERTSLAEHRRRNISYKQLIEEREKTYK